MIEIRCLKCNRLLLKTDLSNGKITLMNSIEIKCPKCGYLQVRTGLMEKYRDKFAQARNKTALV